jgi:hypothetical protein
MLEGEVVGSEEGLETGGVLEFWVDDDSSEESF